MRALLLASIVVIATAACGAPKRVAPTGAKPAAIPELRFAWKLPSAARVEHVRDRDGVRQSQRYLLCASALGGGLIEVRELEHADGRTRPTVLVSADGTVYDVVGLERALERMLGERGTPALREGRLQAPAMLAQLKEKYAETWHLWVDTWLNFEPRQGSQVVEAFIPFGDVELTVPQSFEYLGRAPGEPALIKMRMRSVLEGPEASRALARFVRDTVVLEEPARDHVDRVELRRSVDFEIVTDPATLMPRRVQGKTVTRVTIGGRFPKEKSESDDYRFDWELSDDDSSACRRAPR
jgi:hypothetical protein